MDSILYNEHGESQWAGPLDHVYRAVKHHVEDGLYIVANRDTNKMVLLYREESIVYPLAENDSIKEDGGTTTRRTDDPKAG